MKGSVQLCFPGPIINIEIKMVSAECALLSTWYFGSLFLHNLIFYLFQSASQWLVKSLKRLVSGFLVPRSWWTVLVFTGGEYCNCTRCFQTSSLSNVQLLSSDCSGAIVLQLLRTMPITTVFWWLLDPIGWIFSWMSGSRSAEQLPSVSKVPFSFVIDCVVSIPLILCMDCILYL